MSDIRQSAIHEAGHAVTAWLQDLQVERVGLAINSEGGPGCYVSGEKMDSIQYHLACAITCLGGPLAVAIASGDDAAFLSQGEGAVRDVEEAAINVAKAFQDSLFLYDDCELVWPRLNKGRIKDALRKHWRAVLAVADALLKPPHELRRDEILEVIERAEASKI